MCIPVYILHQEKEQIGRRQHQGEVEQGRKDYSAA